MLKKCWLRDFFFREGFKKRKYKNKREIDKEKNHLPADWSINISSSDREKIEKQMKHIHTQRGIDERIDTREIQTVPLRLSDTHVLCVVLLLF